MIRRILIAGVAALGAFSISLAFAANLGGLNPDNLGAESGAVSSCDTDGVTVSYGDLQFQNGAYELTEITVGGIHDDCDGMTLDVTVVDSGGSVLASKTVTIADVADDTSQALTLDTAVNAADLGNVHVAIS